MARSVFAPGALGESAAPVGGATGHTRRCWGCRLIPTLTFPTLRQLSLPILLHMAAAPLWAEQGSDDHGLEIRFHDVIAEPPVWRVRYVAPGLSEEGVTYADVAEDMQILCAEDALPRVTEGGTVPQTIVITLMSEPVTFGVMTPGVRQFFESYRVEGPRCIWEAF